MKKIIISSLLFIAFLALAFGGIVLYFFITNSPSSSSEKAKTVDNAPLTYAELQQQKKASAQKDTLIYNKAISDRNLTSCESIEDANKKNDCHNMILAIQAEASGNIESCATIPAKDIAIQCQNSIYQDIAIQSGDKASCDKVADVTIAKHCREAIDEKKLRTMLEGGTVTKSSCTNLEIKFQDECLASVTQNNNQDAYTNALASGDPANCTQVQDATLQETCSDTLLLKRALTNNSATDCDGISDATKKSYCVAHIKTKNEAVLFKEYITSSNLNGCSTLTDTNLKDRCHDMVTLSLVRTNKNASLCDGLTNTALLAICQKSAQ